MEEVVSNAQTADSVSHQPPQSSASEIASSVQEFKCTSDALQALFSGRKQLKIPTIAGFNPSQLSEGRKTELKARKRKGKKCSSASSSRFTHVPTTSSSLTVPKLVPASVTSPVMNPPRLVCPKPNASVASISTIQSGRKPEGILPKLGNYSLYNFFVINFV